MENWTNLNQSKKSQFEALLSELITKQKSAEILTKNTNLYSKSSSVAEDKKMEGDDLRQRGDSDDLRSQSCVTPTSQSKLQSTCSKLKSENDKLRVELESTKEKVKEQEIKIERLTMGGEESEKKLLEMETEMVQQCKDAQQKFSKLIDEVTPKMAKIDLDSNSSGDSTMDMKLMEKNVSKKMCEKYWFENVKWR